MPKIRHTVFLVAMLYALALPVATAHASYRDAIFDCAEDSVLDGKYSNAELKKARQHLPTDLAEYTDCADILASAMTGGPGASNRGGSTTPSNPALATETGAQASSQQDLDALRAKTAKDAKKKKAAKVQIAGSDITPGVGGVFDRAGSTEANVLPLPLLLSLIALAAMCALAGALVARRQWPATRRVARRILRR